MWVQRCVCGEFLVFKEQEIIVSHSECLRQKRTVSIGSDYSCRRLGPHTLAAGLALENRARLLYGSE